MDDENCDNESQLSLDATLSKCMPPPFVHMWPWPTTSDLENLFRNAHSHDLKRTVLTAGWKAANAMNFLERTSLFMRTSSASSTRCLVLVPWRNLWTFLPSSSSLRLSSTRTVRARQIFSTFSDFAQPYIWRRFTHSGYGEYSSCELCWNKWWIMNVNNALLLILTE